MGRLFFFGFLVHLLLLSNSPASDRILVVHSYHRGYEGWVNEISKAIKTEIGARDILYNFFYMDTKRHPKEPWILKAAQEAKTLIRDFKPKVVIAVDDNAQAYVVKDYVDKSTVQFVFCGVNADAKKYGYPATNVTGILERTYPGQTLGALKVLLPNTQRVAVISDYSPTSNFLISQIQRGISESESELIIIEYIQPVTFPQWKETIVRLENDTGVDAIMIPLYHTVRHDGAQTSKEPRKVMAWTVANTKIPLVGLIPEFIHHGGLLAVTVSPREHGRIAAKMALDIIAGKKAADIPMQVNKEGYVMVNLKDNEHLPFNASVDIDQIADLVIR